MVIASGARYRRPAVPRLSEFEGRGIWYWASALEARMCAQAEVVLVGGGNSAGQAAVFLSQYAAKVNVLVRGPSLAASMSRYLIDRIEATPNIELRPHTELTSCTANRRRAGGRHLARPRAAPRRSGPRATSSCSSAPIPKPAGSKAAAWRSTRTASCSPVRRPRPPARTPAPLESSVPGVFAVGDVRAGSVKRVGGAIGEGAAAVASIHQHLAAPRPALAPSVSASAALGIAEVGRIPQAAN